MGSITLLLRAAADAFTVRPRLLVAAASAFFKSPSQNEAAQEPAERKIGGYQLCGRVIRPLQLIHGN
jgi:hypothetical protein